MFRGNEGEVGVTEDVVNDCYFLPFFCRSNKTDQETENQPREVKQAGFSFSPDMKLFSESLLLGESNTDLLIHPLQV